MTRISCASLALGLLLLSGCGEKPAEPPPAPAAVVTPPPAPVAAPMIQVVSLDTVQIASPKASMVAGEGTSKLFTTDPQNGSYSAIYQLPQIDAPSTVRIHLTVQSGGIGAVVTDGSDSNNWSTEETYAAPGSETVLELKVKSLGTPQALLLRNNNQAGGASQAVIKSIEVESVG